MPVSRSRAITSWANSSWQDSFSELPIVVFYVAYGLHSWHGFFPVRIASSRVLYRTRLFSEIRLVIPSLALNRLFGRRSPTTVFHRHRALPPPAPA